MEAHTALTPSIEARRLFGSMVARAEGMAVGLSQLIAIGVERARQGDDPNAGTEMDELVQAGWIRRDDESGGWRFTDGD